MMRFVQSPLFAAVIATFLFGIVLTPVQTAEAQTTFGGEEFGLSRKQLVEAVEAAEAKIARCMAQEGFEYIPVNFKTVRRGMTSDKSLPGLSDREFVSRHGFGISTLYTGLGPQGSELRTAAQIGLGQRNIEIFRNLSPAEQVSYNRALLGDYPEVTFAVGLEIEDFSATGGCTRQAIEQVFTPEQLRTNYLNPIDAAIDKDPRMIAALGKYADCMRSEGFSYSHEKEVEPDIRRRLREVTQGQPVQLLSAEASRKLSDLQDYERALARIAVYCEEAVLDPVADRIEAELKKR